MNSHSDLSKQDAQMTTPVASFKGKSPAMLASFCGILRSPLTAWFEPLFSHLLDEIPGWVVSQCETLPAAQQQRYMDIIHGLRRHRVEIEAGIENVLQDHLQRFSKLEQSSKDKKKSLLDMDMSEMGLVDAAEVDSTIAIESIADRFAPALDPELSNIFLRLKPYAEQLVMVGQMPCHPRVIFQIALDGMQQLSLSPIQRMEVIQHFARLWDIKALQELKQIIIATVEQARVPELDRFQPIKSTDSPDKPKPKLKSEAVSGGSGGGSGPINMPPPIMQDGVPVLHVAQNGGLIVDPALLAQQAQQLALLSQSIASAPLAPVNPHPFATEQILGQSQVITLLEQLQSLQPSSPLDQSNIKASVAAVRDGIREQLHSDADTTQVIAKDDANLIDLVSTLFDYILDDGELPTPMKALIGRLQIPILKVALMDKAFFAGEEHPARKLLNLLAKAGMSWDENSKSGEGLYKKVEEVVHLVLNEFHADMRLFERLLADFTQFHQAQLERLAAMDARVREAEENRAKAETARTTVQQILNQRLKGLKLPLSIVKLLQEGWRHVLYLAALKEGTESEQWRQAVKVVDALIWSMLPPAGDVQWIERLRGVSPKLINSLRKGLMSVNFDPRQLEVMLNEIAQSHQEIIGGVQVPLVEILDPADKIALREGQPAPASVEQAMTTATPNEIKFLAMPKAEVSAYTGETLPTNNPNVIAVRQMPVGTWVEFVQSDNHLRHRLVAKIRATEKLIFANKRGIKAAELSMMQLAIELSQSRAVILEEQPQMFDRALMSVVDGLKSLSA